jgi:hypothetical protein
MQECVLHIKLVDRAGMGDGQGKHRVNGCWLDHRAEGLIIVDVRALGEAAKDPMSLVPLQVPSELDLCLKIHLPMTTLEPTGRGTRFQVLLAIKASYSSFTA